MKTCPKKLYYKSELRAPYVAIFGHTLYCNNLLGFFPPPTPIFLLD